MKEEARTLLSAAQEEKRKQSVRLYQKGLKYREISAWVGVTQLTVGRWIRNQRAEGCLA